jgi:hypothetical protein
LIGLRKTYKEPFWPIAEVQADVGHGSGRSTMLRKNPLDPFNIERFAEAQKESLGRLIFTDWWL